MKRIYDQHVGQVVFASSILLSRIEVACFAGSPSMEVGQQAEKKMYVIGQVCIEGMNYRQGATVI